MANTLKRCSRCTLPETMPQISFDQNGICSYCQTHEKFKIKGESNLIKILDAYRNPGKKFECIVNISSGRDSAYTLLKVVRDYRMKVLAVNYQNPFTDLQAGLSIVSSRQYVAKKK